MLVAILAIWIYCFILSTTPYFGFGGYTFYRQGGVCIPPLPPESWWLVVYIVYSTVPVMLLIAMIVATFIFAVRFARRQRKLTIGPASVSNAGVRPHVKVGKTVSAVSEISNHGPEQLNDIIAAKEGRKNQSHTNFRRFREFSLHNSQSIRIFNNSSIKYLLA